MKIYNDVKIIRELLGLTQEELAKKLGTTYEIINRWENDVVEPEDSSINKLYSFAYKNKIYFNKLYEQLFIDEYGSNMKILFHGAKSDINWPLDLNHSKNSNDFGDGFYLGETFEQAATYISYSKSHNVYSFVFDISNLNVLKFDVSLDWMIAIAYYRGWLDDYKNSEIIKKILLKVDNADVIIAPIADNRMFDLIDDFVNGNLTDLQCKHALAVTNLGCQYVLKTDNAIKKLKVIKKMFLSDAEKENYVNIRLEANKIGLDKVKIARSEYRGKGKYIEEIMK